MLLSELITIERILPRMSAATRDEAIAELAALVAAARGEEIQRRVAQVLGDRERLASTGIGNGIAIPHGKLDLMGELVVGLGRSEAGVDFFAVDGQPVHVFFVLLAPETSTNVHLKALARISKLCRSAGFLASLRQAGDAAQMHALLVQEEGRLKP